MEILDRWTAAEQRLTKFFTGRPCKRGHICERYTKTGSCIECLHPKFQSAISNLSEVTRRMVKVVFFAYNHKEAFNEDFILTLNQTVEPRLKLHHIINQHPHEPLNYGSSRFFYRTLPEFKSLILESLNESIRPDGYKPPVINEKTTNPAEEPVPNTPEWIKWASR